MNREEQYICDEAPEISVGERPEWIQKLAAAFPAMQSRNYQWYFTGQLVFILGGNTLFAMSLIFFTFTHSVAIALLLLFFTGTGLLMQFATMNTTIQHMIDDRMRGRVMSIYTVMFLCLSPIGNFEIGFVAEHLGTSFAIRLGATIVFLFGLLVYLRRNKVREAQRKFTSE